MKYMLIHCIDEAGERSQDPARRVSGAPAIESWIFEMEGRGVLLHGGRLRYVSDAMIEVWPIAGNHCGDAVLD